MIRISPVFNSKFRLFKVNWSTNFRQKIYLHVYARFFRIDCISVNIKIAVLMKSHKSGLFAGIQDLNLNLECKRKIETLCLHGFCKTTIFTKP